MAAQKTNLQANNTDLQAILNSINALPEAGGGGSSETVSVRYNAYPEPGSMIYYIDGSNNLQSSEIDEGSTFNVLKNSIFVTVNLMLNSLSSCTQIAGDMGVYAYLATG